MDIFWRRPVKRRVPLEVQSSRTPPSAAPLSIASARDTCIVCSTDKKKCFQSDPQGKCDRCEELGYPCSLVQNGSDNNTKRRKLSRMKCEQCRHAKQKCLPTLRVWPQRCDRCLAKGFPCSEPQKASRADDHQASASQAAAPERILALAESDASGSDDAQVLEMRPRRPRRGAWLYPPETPKRMSFRDLVRKAHRHYFHQPLQDHDIRVLVLHPGVGNDTIYCHLVPTTFPRHDLVPTESRYTALSYEWGWATDNPIHEILVLDPPSSKSGRSSLAEIAWKIARNDLGKSFYIRPNLFNALRHLRSPEKNITLWVDALCINAYDMNERNGQTARMPAIYRNAANVSIWLGNATEFSDVALSFISELLDLQRLDILVNDFHASEKWFAFSQLMTNNWFSRRWVIQEVVLARSATLHCGQMVVRWTDFADAVSLFNASLDQIKDSCRLSGKRRPEIFSNGHTFGANTFVEATSNLVRRSSNGEVSSLRYSIEALVSKFIPFKVTNPRDAIYSLLPLAKDASIIAVDYSQSVGKVFADFVLSSITHSRSLDIICRHWAPAGGYNLPSWILPVSGSPYGSSGERLRDRVNGDSFVGSPGRKLYNSSRGHDVGFLTFEPDAAHALESDIFADASLLRVRGFRVDRINDIGARCIQGIIDSESLDMGGLEDSRRRDGEDPETNLFDVSIRGPRFPESLWRTLVADRDEEGNDPPPWYRRAFLNCLDQRTMEGDIMTNELTRQSAMPRFVTKFLQRVQAVIWNRKFFLTERFSFFGLAPSHARHGDIICILFGCSVPVVLRDDKHSWNFSLGDGIEIRSKTFQFIGECYVHGLMDGEAKEIMGLEEELFTLE